MNFSRSHVCKLSRGFTVAILALLSVVNERGTIRANVTIPTDKASLPGPAEAPVTHPLRSVSQCFHVRGVPTLKLRCPTDNIVHVQQAFYGAPTIPSICGYRPAQMRTADEGQTSDGGHCIQLAELTTNCNGRYHCTVHVTNPYLMNCRTYAIYMQVNYICLTKADIVDTCTVTSRSTVPQGFLRSPSYPDSNYPPNMSCLCQLSTSDSGIIIRLLDWALLTVGDCEGDFLKIHDTLESRCVDDKRLEDSIELSRYAMIEFRTDSKEQDRGFFLKLNGKEDGQVQLTCQPAQESVSNPAAAIYESNAERMKTVKDILHKSPPSVVDIVTSSIRPSNHRYTTATPRNIGDVWRHGEEYYSSASEPDLYSLNRNAPHSSSRAVVIKPFNRLDSSRSQKNFTRKEHDRYIGQDVRGSGTRPSSLSRQRLTDEGESEETNLLKDASSVFKNDEEPSGSLDFSELRTNLMINSDEVRIVTGVLVGVLLLVGVIILVVLTLRRK